MSSNVFPEKIVKTTSDGEGGFKSQIYSIDNWNNGGCMAIIIMLAVAIAIAPISGLLFFGWYCLYTDDGFNLVFPALVFSVYMFIDLQHNFILSNLISIFYEARGMEITKEVAATTIIASSLSLFFGKKIFIFTSKNNWLFLFLMLLIYNVIYQSIAKII